MMHICTYESPIGQLLLAESENQICGAWFSGARYFGAGLAPDAIEMTDHPILKLAHDWLDRYFSGLQPTLGDLPILISGSPFRKRVLRALMAIPYGETTTYGALARSLATEIGGNFSAQAVGGAVGHNPISVIIPCHRVIGADGSLTGYAGGLEKKRWLLDHETMVKPS